MACQGGQGLSRRGGYRPTCRHVLQVGPRRHLSDSTWFLRPPCPSSPFIANARPLPPSGPSLLVRTDPSTTLPPLPVVSLVALDQLPSSSNQHPEGRHTDSGCFLAVPQGVLVDLYVPRKCSATGRLITAKDHASIQITVADVDANGVAIKGAAGTVIALVGSVRANGEADDSINRLATKAGRTSLPLRPFPRRLSGLITHPSLSARSSPQERLVLLQVSSVGV